MESPMDARDPEVTRLLQDLSSGQERAADRLFPLIHRELKELASHFLAGERPGHTLQPTALVHEAYLRLAGSEGLQAESRGHFFRLAARAMRRILIDHARARTAAKRGGRLAPLSLDRDPLDPRTEPDLWLLALDEALEALERLDPRRAAVVEYRFYGGMGHAEIARLLGLSVATVERDWALAKAFLHRRVTDGPEDS